MEEQVKNGAYEVGYKKPPKDTQFKKGVSGNPGGKPSTISGWAKFYGEQDYISGTLTFSKDNQAKDVSFSIRNGDGPINALVALQLIKGACEGDLFFIKELLDRTEGKAPQTITHTKKSKVVVKPTSDGGIEIVEQEVVEEEEYDEFVEIEEKHQDE